MTNKVYNTAELAKNNTKDNLLLAIHGKVYNISEFIDEHPGGEEVLLDEAGKDATESFEDVGHSDEARSIMSKYYVGEYQATAGEKTKSTFHSTPKPIPAADPIERGSKLQYVIALAVVAGAVLYKLTR
ncbi:hypothetical protein FBU30_008433 [Linnemannia zychae]|nr:hypothetical protein FBU30_008433 [Linnemannia zychae]